MFELNRNFRNEGADATHNPEFTMLEAYEAYGDYDTMLRLMQEMVQHVATRTFGSPVARRADADGKVTEYDLSGRVAGVHGQRGHLRGAGRDGRQRHDGRGRW